MHCCHGTYRRRVGHHPRNGGGPRIGSNVLSSGGVETTISCGAIPRCILELFELVLPLRLGTGEVPYV